MGGTKMLKSEIAQISMNTTERPDVIEMLAILDGFAIDTIMNLMSKIYDIGYMP